MISVQPQSSTRIKRLEQRRDRIQTDWDLLSEKVRNLREARVLETRSDEKFRLDRQIDEEEARLAKLDAALSEIESEIEFAFSQVEAGGKISQSSGQGSEPPTNGSLQDKLYKFLFSLDFEEQERLFQDVLRRCKGTAFLIHGEKNYGQLWLLKQLLESIDQSEGGRIYHCHLRSGVVSPDVKTIWYRFGKWLGGETKSTTETTAIRREIASEVVARLKNQDLILVFHDVEHTYDGYLSELISQFWQPLVSAVYSTQDAGGYFRLLMFLVDCEGKVATWKTPAFASQVDADWKPTTPIKLPSIAPFTEEMLHAWIEKHLARVLRRDVELPPFRGAANQLLQSSANGVPGYVLKAIYELCGYDWWEEEDRRWKL
jgi:hypothetical protein